MSEYKGDNELFERKKNQDIIRNRTLNVGKVGNWNR